MNNITIIVSSVLILSISGSLYFIKKTLTNSKLKKKEIEIDGKIEKAKREFDKIISKAQEESKNYKSKLIQQAEDEIKARHRTVAEIEKRATDKENNLIKREQQINDRYKSLDNERQNLKQLQNKQSKIIVDLSKKLENL